MLQGAIWKDQIKVNGSPDVIGSSVENEKWRIGVATFLRICCLWQQQDTFDFFFAVTGYFAAVWQSQSSSPYLCKIPRLAVEAIQ